MQAPPPSSFVKAVDVELHYHDVGSGPALVWLHGAGPGATAWSNFRGNVPAFAGHRSLLIDLPQFGQSSKPVIDEPRIAYHTLRVTAALENLGVDTASFIGNSMGGAVATRIAIDRPSLVDRLIVMGGAGIASSGEPPEGIRLLMDLWRTGPTRDKVEAILRTFVHDPSLLTDELVDERFASSADPELVEARAASGAVVVEDLSAELSAVQAKTLLLWGREDRIIPLDSALAYVRGIPDAELRVLPRCGHWVQVEQREVFNDAVLRFLLEPVAKRQS